MNIAIISINIYIVFTLLFFIIKYFKVDKDNLTLPNTNWLIYYFIISFFILLIQNTYYSSLNDGETKCVVQPLTLFIYTILPLCLIMGPIIILLIKMNLNRIFANTFGLLLAPKIILDSNNKTALFFYNDPNVLLQEIEPNLLFNKQELQNKLKILIGEDIILSPQNHADIISQYHIKQNVGYFVWLVFTGIVASLVSANSILLQDCIIE
jgi:hypothetical protein